MAKLSFATQAKSLLRGANQALVVGRAERLESGLPILSDDLSALVRALAFEVQGTGGGSATSLAGDELARVTVAVLPGPGSRYNCPARPELVARAVRSLKPGLGRIALVLCLEDEAHLEATLTGVARGLPLFDRKTQGGDRELKIQILALGPDGSPLRIGAETKTRMAAIRAAAELVDRPPTELNPEAFAAEARQTLDSVKRVSVKEIVGPALARQKLGGIYGVGKAAAKAPRLVIATYRPARPKGPHVALVGKGVTFDTGGLHLKGRGSMEGMKCDMGGAAATYGAFRVIAESGPPMQVSLLLCLAENAIGPDSYKPDDILTMHSGKTVEINNTDAEGRLCLADGLSYAVRSLGASVVMNAATLTGAQMVATGSTHATLVSNDPELEALMVAAGQASGDLVHPMPFAPELYQQEFKSPVADMRNSVKNRANAQPSCAAQFVYSHIEGTDARWAHVDLAGPAWQNDRGTGFGVSLLARAVLQLAE